MNARSTAVWRANFVAGLAVVLPAVASIAIVVWLFGTVSNITDTLLFFLPREWTHRNRGEGPVHWYWSLVALLWATLLISLIGRFTRYYVGQKLIGWVDEGLLRIPLLNKIYGTLKQFNEAFYPHKKSAFRQVVLVEFPRLGQHSIGFVTNTSNLGIPSHAREPLVSVFIPTTPNPTTGFLILVPESSLKRLDLSVADGLKFIVSLGAVSPEALPPPAPPRAEDR